MSLWLAMHRSRGWACARACVSVWARAREEREVFYEKKKKKGASLGLYTPRARIEQ